MSEFSNEPDFDRLINMPPGPNEVTNRIAGLAGGTPFLTGVSAGRSAMYASQSPQAITAKGITDPRTRSGIEMELATTTFDVRIPANSRVIAVIPRLGRRWGLSSPEKTIIYEQTKINDATGREYREIGHVSCPDFISNHKLFGFKPDYLIENVSVDDTFYDETVIAQSPSIRSGIYRNGRETNIATMSINSIIEDGVQASHEWCESMEVTMRETKVFSFGKKQFPLNIYAKGGEYRFVPDVGECVGDDGILVALRTYNELLAPVMMTKKAVTQIDLTHDDTIKVRPGAKVVDIRVTHNQKIRAKQRTPYGMFGQAQRYFDADQQYYEDLIKYYDNLVKNTRGKVNLARKTHAMFREAIKHVRVMSNMSAEQTYHTNPLDDWRIEITIEYNHVPGYGAKVTGRQGNKGVITRLVPRADMPKDERGVYADMVFGGGAIFKRMITSAAAEQYVNGAAYTLTEELMSYLNGKSIFDVKDSDWEKVSKRLEGYLKIVSPEILLPEAYDPDKPDLLRKDIIHDELHNSLDDEGTIVGIVNRVPTNHKYPMLQMGAMIKKHYRPYRSKVTYRDTEGVMQTTKREIMIGSVYVMLLEKLAQWPAGVATARLGNFGVPTKTNAKDKDASRRSEQPIRFGESEFRLFGGILGRRLNRLLSLRSSNSDIRKDIARRQMSTGKPTALKEAYDYDKYKDSDNRVVTLVKTILRVTGVEYFIKKARVAKAKKRGY